MLENPIKCPECGSPGPLLTWRSVRYRAEWSPDWNGEMSFEDTDMPMEPDTDPEGTECVNCGHAGSWEDFVKE